ncbi:hypothetical protein U91I_03222 [alpha proteobacterium U9-1i]|nr:hypothetical protein U91I_03222 [alpha proteobacterium U9-1i]
MTTELAERRKNRAVGLFLLAGALAVVAAITAAIDMRASRPNTASGPVIAGLAESIGRAQRIIVTSTEASYRIERTQRGWAMQDRGNYPVNAAALARLTEGLQSLQYVRRMTGDPTKHERLGVGDPREGGRGVLVQVEDGARALLVDVILGVEPNGSLYVRRTGQDQVWSARGELPPLRSVASWLELRPLSLDPASLARVEVVPSVGRPYTLAREAQGQDFQIVLPARLAAVAQSSVNAVGERITALAPTDVMEAPAIQGAPRARVRVITFDGVLIDGELIDSDGKTWLKLVARAQTPEQEPAALEVNNRAAAWAFALSGIDVDTLVAPLSTLVPGAAPAPPPPPPQ